MTIALVSQPTDVVSVQVTHHPGWHARVNGARRDTYRDGLGLMWLRPNCAGNCTLDLTYDGGAELLSFRVVSYAALFGGPLVLFLLRRRT